ncbi:MULTISPECIES: hypothetical protein [Streptomyces]|uniref:hypothetical protein n=1 Tax=Streptomyces TaxID=1883 RepID=UPI00345C2316
MDRIASMPLGDSLASTALTDGIGSTFDLTTDRRIRLAIHLDDDTFQIFTKPVGSEEDQWRAGDFTAPGRDCPFDEAVSAEWGRGLSYVLRTRRRRTLAPGPPPARRDPAAPPSQERRLMRTIARNATRQIAKIKAEYSDCRKRSLDHDFASTPADASAAWAALATYSSARLHEWRDHYRISVHSNLWYELHRPGSKPEELATANGPRVLRSRLKLTM